MADLAAKEGVGCAEADIVGVLVGVCGALHAARPHNHIVEPAVLQRHLSAPLLDQDAPEQVQDSCTSTSTASQLVTIDFGGVQLRCHSISLVLAVMLCQTKLENLKPQMVMKPWNTDRKLITCWEADFGSSQRGHHDILVNACRNGCLHQCNGAVPINLLGVAEIQGLALWSSDGLDHLLYKSRQ